MYLTKRKSSPFKIIARSSCMLLAAAGLTACGNGSAGDAGRSGQTVTSGKADIGGPFNLIDQDSLPVSQADLLGKPHLIYFGFTYCPDVCPTALQKMGAAQELLGENGDDLGYVLISVDPERDTPEILKQYVGAPVFPKGMRGFTGTAEQVEAAKAAYKVYAVRAELEGESEYTMDHSDIIYLMDKDGNFLDYFYGRSTPQDMQVRLRLHLRTGK